MAKTDAKKAKAEALKRQSKKKGKATPKAYAKKEAAYEKAKAEGKGSNYLQLHPQFAKKRARKTGEAAPLKNKATKKREKTYAKADETVEKIYGTGVEGAGKLGRMDTPTNVQGVDNAQTVNAQTIDTSGSSVNTATDVAAKNYADSTKKDALVQDALQRQQESLAGFNTAENQALTEKAMAGIDQDAATQMRQLQIMQGQAGQSGDAAIAQRAKILKNQAALRQGARQDVLAQNVALKNQNLQNYTGAAQGAAAQQAAQQNAALGTYTGVAGVASGQALQGAVSNQQANLGAQTTNAANQMAVNNTNLANNQYNQQNAQSVQQYNIGQGEKESAGKIGTYMGEAGAIEATQGQIKSDKRADEMLEEARRGIY